METGRSAKKNIEITSRENDVEQQHIQAARMHIIYMIVIGGCVLHMLLTALLCAILPNRTTSNEHAHTKHTIHNNDIKINLQHRVNYAMCSHINV